MQSMLYSPRLLGHRSIHRADALACPLGNPAIILQRHRLLVFLPFMTTLTSFQASTSPLYTTPPLSHPLPSPSSSSVFTRPFHVLTVGARRSLCSRVAARVWGGLIYLPSWTASQLTLKNLSFSSIPVCPQRPGSSGDRSRFGPPTPPRQNAHLDQGASCLVHRRGGPRLGARRDDGSPPILPSTRAPCIRQNSRHSSLLHRRALEVAGKRPGKDAKNPTRRTSIPRRRRPRNQGAHPVVVGER